MKNIIDQKLIHQGYVFSLYREKVTLPNGVVSERDVVRHPGASVIVPLTDKQSILFIKQYRHAVDDYLIELPAGTLEKNEAPLDCAKREVREETGYSASTWEELGKLYPTPGFCDELQYIYLASDLIKDLLPQDEDEIIEVIEIKLSDIIKMVNENKIKDAKTLSALFMFNSKKNLLSR
jgi:ADP-ribose pyrophosphatase